MFYGSGDPLNRLFEMALTSTIVSDILCPRDYSRGGGGALTSTIVSDYSRGALSLLLSVRPSVRHALQYRVCVINSSHTFQWVFLKPYILFVDIMKMCMWSFGGDKIIFDRITAF